MGRKLKIYLDTSVISALFDHKNPQRQQLTGEFFKIAGDFDIYVSDLVLAEINNTRELQLKAQLHGQVDSYTILQLNEESRVLSNEYVRHGAIPADYNEDALHISIATSYGIDYLLSWNFTHMVRVKTRKIVAMVNVSLGYPDLEIITPAELL
jgi:predicted nucleic acid-binding protein